MFLYLLMSANINPYMHYKLYCKTMKHLLMHTCIENKNCLLFPLKVVRVEEQIICWHSVNYYVWSLLCNWKCTTSLIFYMFVLCRVISYLTNCCVALQHRTCNTPWKMHVSHLASWQLFLHTKNYPYIHPLANTDSWLFLKYILT